MVLDETGSAGLPTLAFVGFRWGGGVGRSPHPWTRSFWLLLPLYRVLTHFFLLKSRFSFEISRFRCMDSVGAGLRRDAKFLRDTLGHSRLALLRIYCKLFFLFTHCGQPSFRASRCLFDSRSIFRHPSTALPQSRAVTVTLSDWQTFFYLMVLNGIPYHFTIFLDLVVVHLE